MAIFVGGGNKDATENIKHIVHFFVEFIEVWID